MNINITSTLSDIFNDWSGNKPQKIIPIKAHGSERKYFRLIGRKINAIGVYNKDRSENIAFLTLAKHFFHYKLPVPEVYAENIDWGFYLLQDLGDLSLFALLNQIREKEGFSETIIQLYEKVIHILPKFQIEAAKNIDYSICYPRHSFDKQSMMWDLNYFKYYFLKLAKISFNEQKLEDDFQNLIDFLLQADSNYFLYRDFQSRNIMILDQQPYFIDFQGGRKGALQYDLASLLFDAKADIPPDLRNHFLEKYLNTLTSYIHPDRHSFMKYYFGYVLIRIMQSLGTYGFRGFYERKSQFLQSVPYAIHNLDNLLSTVKLPVQLPELMQTLRRLIQSPFLRQLGNVNTTLTVRISSFSYKHGIPLDHRGHGGGFVFDCRALPNPGKLARYSNHTGKDRKVIHFFKKYKSVEHFLNNIQKIIKLVITDYQKRNYTDLMITFGCTGGQHRSVYCANQLAKYLKKNFDINIEVNHLELEG
jgi:aminoglycoside/choline kinase family phosphotransferase